MPKKSAPRVKKLKLVDTSPIGLTSAQAQELSDLYRSLSHTASSSARIHEAEEIRKITFDRCLYIYIESLCHDAKAQNAGSKKRGNATFRGKILKDIHKTYGRDLSPADIIKELTKHAPVPTYAQDAIRRDYLRITV